MTIPPKYEDVVANLESALAREAALREDRDNRPDVSIKNCIFKGENANGSQAFEFETLEGGLNKLTKINLDGWLCYGPSGESPVTVLQQLLTVAEQLLSRALQYGGMTPDWRDSVEEALKTDAEGEGS